MDDARLPCRAHTASRAGMYPTRKPATDRMFDVGLPGGAQLTSSFCALELSMLVGMRCRVLQFEVRALAATCW